MQKSILITGCSSGIGECVARGGVGRIIQNSSILGFAGMPMLGAYNVSKFAIEGFSDTLRLELADTGIYVSLIEPGPIKSRFRENAYQAFQRYIRVDNSVHRERYLCMIERFRASVNEQPFTLPAQAVLKRVLHALENRRRHYKLFCVTATG